MRQKKTDIGKMQSYVTVQQAAIARDSIGGATLTWTTFIQAWARVEPYHGHQRTHAENPEARVTHRVVMWYDDVSTITNKMRINLDNRLLQIHWFRNVEERAELMEIYCEEGAPS